MQPGRGGGDVQLGAGQRQAAAVVARLGIGEIDTLVGGVTGRDEDAQHAVLTLPIDWGRIADQDLLSLLGHQPNGPDLFGDQHAAIGQEGQPPWQVEGGHRGHGEGQAGFGLLFARIDLGPGHRRHQGEVQHQRRFREFHRHFALFLLALKRPTFSGPARRCPPCISMRARPPSIRQCRIDRCGARQDVRHDHYVSISSILQSIHEGTPTDPRVRIAWSVSIAPGVHPNVCLNAAM